MARRRGPRVVVTFPSTHAAVACEDACHAAGVAGRIVPVPVSISADCGLAWALPPEALPEFARLASERGLAHSTVYDLVGPEPTPIDL